MIFRTLAGLAAGLALASAAQAAPAAGRSAPAPSKAAVKALDDQWQARFGSWSKDLGRVMQEQAGVLRTVGEGAPIAQGFAADHDPRSGAAWARDWAPARRQQIQAYRAHADAMIKAFPEPPASIGPVLGSEASAAEMKRYMTTLHRNLAQVADMSDELVEIIEKTANGDPAAAIQANARAPELGITMLRGEIDMGRTLLLMRKPGDVGWDLVTCEIEIDQGLIELLELRRQQGAGANPDPAAFKDRMLGHARAARGAADKLALDSKRETLNIERMKGPKSVWAVRLHALGPNYAESAEVERAIADGLAALTDNIDNTDAASEAALRSKMVALQDLNQRRLDLDARRKRILAGEAE